MPLFIHSPFIFHCPLILIFWCIDLSQFLRCCIGRIFNSSWLWYFIGIIVIGTIIYNQGITISITGNKLENHYRGQTYITIIKVTIDTLCSSFVLHGWISQWFDSFLMALQHDADSTGASRLNLHRFKPLAYLDSVAELSSSPHSPHHPSNIPHSFMMGAAAIVPVIKSNESIYFHHRSRCIGILANLVTFEWSWSSNQWDSDEHILNENQSKSIRGTTQPSHQVRLPMVHSWMCWWIPLIW